ncbi:hypothetical protein EV122DRAFT_283846 [Schizophyllum commune]
MSSPAAERSLLQEILPELIDEDRCIADECLSGELNPQPRNVASEFYCAADALHTNWEMGSRSLATYSASREALDLLLWARSACRTHDAIESAYGSLISSAGSLRPDGYGVHVPRKARPSSSRIQLLQSLHRIIDERLQSLPRPPAPNKPSFTFKIFQTLFGDTTPAQQFFCQRWVGPLFVFAPLVVFFEGCKHWFVDGILCALVIPLLGLVVLREYNKQTGAGVVGEHTRIAAALFDNCRTVHSAGLKFMASWTALGAVLRKVDEASPGGRISDHHVSEVKALFSAYDHHFRMHESTREKAYRLHNIELVDHLLTYPVQCGRADYEKVDHSGWLNFERVRPHDVPDGYSRHRAYVEAVDRLAQALEKFAPDDLLMRPYITSAHSYLAYTRAIGQAQSALDAHLKIALGPEDAEYAMSLAEPYRSNSEEWRAWGARLGEVVDQHAAVEYRSHASRVPSSGVYAMVLLLTRLLAFPCAHYLYFCWVPRDDVVLWSLLAVVYGFFSLAILKPLSAATIKPLAGVFWRFELSGDVVELQDSLTHLALQEEKLTREWLGLRQSVTTESASRLEMVLPRYLSTYSTMGETLPARSVDISAAFYRAIRRSGSMYEHARAVQALYDNLYT